MSPTAYAHPDGSTRTLRTGGVRTPAVAFEYGVDEAATIARAGTTTPRDQLPNVHNGNLVITTDGQTYENLLVTGWVEDRANNTTLRNVWVDVGASLMQSYSPPTQAGIFTLFDKTGGVYENVTIAPTNPTVDTYGIVGAGYTLYDADIRDCVDSIQMNKTGTVTIRGGHFHLPRWYTTDPRQTNSSDKSSHSDLIQVLMGQLDIRGTVLDVGDTGVNARTEGSSSAGFAILVSRASTSATSVTADKCWFEGVRPYSHVKVGEAGRGTVPLALTGNRFTTDAQNPIIHGSTNSINAATITGNTGPDGQPLASGEIWADSGTP